jgi:hypothetical protein
MSDVRRLLGGGRKLQLIADAAFFYWALRLRKLGRDIETLENATCGGLSRHKSSS